MSAGTRILRRSDVAGLLSLEECIRAVEAAFRLLGEGKIGVPGILGMHVANGGFHIKAATMDGGRGYFAAKTNANFPGNPQRAGLPAIQGTVCLCDAENGYPLALMDSIEITLLRTAAASAVAARHLARRDPKVITICGCGNQGSVQLHAIYKTFPGLQHAFVFDIDESRAHGLAARMQTAIAIPVEAVRDLRSAVAASNICVTCTPSRKEYLDRGCVRRGAFIAAVGADNPEKSELSPSLLAASKVVVDALQQASTIGDLHHAITAGAMTADRVYAELAEIVAGKKPGRTNDDEIIVFDSTGLAIQDVAAAIVVYERAVAQDIGLNVDFAA